jgi:hypothetical protein
MKKIHRGGLAKKRRHKENTPLRLCVNKKEDLSKQVTLP